jgi:hypothetical protein
MEASLESVSVSGAISTDTFSTAAGGSDGVTDTWFRQLDLAPFDGLNWPHLKACDLLFRVGLGGRSP